MTSEDTLRKHILWLLQGGDAHMGFQEAVADFPIDRINELFPNGTYSPWALVEHLRITQWDILDFTINSNYQDMEWPKDYWPPQGRTATAEEWHKSIADFQSDLNALIKIVRDPNTDLYAKIPHGTGQTILREMLLVADHNAYHIGEFAIMRQVMGTWPKNRSA
jgi:hypothetical protein